METRHFPKFSGLWTQSYGSDSVSWLLKSSGSHLVYLFLSWLSRGIYSDITSAFYDWSLKQSFQQAHPRWPTRTPLKRGFKLQQGQMLQYMKTSILNVLHNRKYFHSIASLSVFPNIVLYGWFRYEFLWTELQANLCCHIICSSQIFKACLCLSGGFFYFFIIYFWMWSSCNDQRSLSKAI